MLNLGQIAEILDATLVGDAAIEVDSLGTLQSARDGQLSFLANPRYRNWLEETKASAVLCTEEQQPHCQVAALVVKDPYLAFAKISHYFDVRSERPPGIHPSAIISPSATLGQDVHIGPNVVIEDNVVLGDACVVMANTVVGANSRLGKGVTLWSNVTIYHNVTIGAQSQVHSATVIGADGFGFAPSSEGWQKVAQVGGVTIGEHVDIGAGCTIDRGAIEDTVIHDGVIMDDQVHVAHNVSIGEGTAIAGKVGFAGSAKVGKNCVFAGMAGVAGHIEITDNVQVMAMTTVSNSIKEPGLYAATPVADKHAQWRKSAVRFRQLDDLFRRVKQLERQLAEHSNQGDDA